MLAHQHNEYLSGRSVGIGAWTGPGIDLSGRGKNLAWLHLALWFLLNSTSNEVDSILDLFAQVPSSCFELGSRGLARRSSLARQLVCLTPPSGIRMTLEAHYVVTAKTRRYVFTRCRVVAPPMRLRPESDRET
jgi:hypothetical protein